VGLLACPLMAKQPDTDETRLLQFLVEERRKLVDEKTRQQNRLIDCLKLYFPQVLHWFDDPAGALAGAFLERWPSLQAARRAHPGTLKRFFHQHNCRREDRIEERIHAIQEGTPATGDAAVLEACAMTARGLVALLDTLRVQIAELVAAHPDGALFASLPGAGAALTPRLITVFGTRRDRFGSAYEVQCYSGIAPVTETSGKSRQTHVPAGEGDRRTTVSPLCLKTEVFHHFTPPRTGGIERPAIQILGHPSTLQRKLQQGRAKGSADVRAALTPIQTGERKPAAQYLATLDVNADRLERSGSFGCDLV
jgi:hypothetical protein